MARVYVVGGGGSGKTTLARLLAQRLSLPFLCLDDVYAAAGRGAAAGADHRARWQARVAEELGRDSWVVEGNFPGWLGEAADRADIVVWLDVPFRVAAWRILRRHVLADLRGRNPHPGYRRLWRFLGRQRAYYADTERSYRARRAAGPDRWSGADYGRAAVAAHSRSVERKLVRVTGGCPHAIARAVLTRLSGAAPPDAQPG